MSSCTLLAHKTPTAQPSAFSLQLKAAKYIRLPAVGGGLRHK